MSDIPDWKNSVADLVQKALGPFTEQVGLHLGDRARAWRERNMTKILNLADERALEAHLDINEIPPRVAIHVLSRGSLTDDETLQQMWAELLVQASSDRDIAERTPIYSGILAELD